MKYCTRCLYPENHPLNIVFDEDGVCSGCRVHEEKDALDWDIRFKKLKELVEPYKSSSGMFHDCIIPVSGAGDSYYIVDVVKNKLGMNPLLVSYNQQYNTPVGIRNLAYLKTLFDCDSLQQTVSPDRVKRVTRESLRLMGSMYWHCLAGKTAFPVQIATRFKIPLIIWGEHQGLEQVGMFSHLDEVEMSRKYRMEHDLMGYEAEDLLRESVELSEKDVSPYVYPHEKDLASAGVRGIYLGNYMRWDSKSQHEEMIAKYGYETLKQQRTFDSYNHVDSYHYAGIHDYIKYVKYGYSKVTDHLSREIRFNRMTREEAGSIVAHYQKVVPNDLHLFLDWLEMPEGEFFELIDAHRDTKAWEHDGKQWVAKAPLFPSGSHERIDEAAQCDYSLENPKGVSDDSDGYTLIGRGWVDDWVGNP